MPEVEFNPFSDEHCQCLDAVLESSAAVAACLAKCKASGLEVGDLVAKNERQAAIAGKLRSAFFGSQPQP